LSLHIWGGYEFFRVLSSVSNNKHIKELILGEYAYRSIFCTGYTADQNAFLSMLDHNYTLLSLSFDNRIVDSCKPYIKRNRLLTLAELIFPVWDIYSALKLSTNIPSLPFDIISIIILFVINENKELIQDLVKEKSIPECLNRRSLSFWKPCEPQQHFMYIRDRVRVQFATKIIDLRVQNGYPCSLIFNCYNPTNGKFLKILGSCARFRSSSSHEYFSDTTIQIESSYMIKKFLTHLNMQEKEIREIFDLFKIAFDDHEAKYRKLGW
jgi:hypothetical protein